MKVAKFTTCLFLISSLSFVGCINDKKASLNGRWEMINAELNGQPAPLLQKMYFQFEGKNVTTNFNAETSDETSLFIFKNSKIIKKSAVEMEFTVTSLTDSTLEMKTELNGFDYKLVLQHVVQ